MNKCIIAAIVAMALALPNLSLADEPMSDKAWIKMLKKCRLRAYELHRSGVRMEKTLQDINRRVRGDRGATVDVSNKLDEIKEERREMSAKIKNYKNCAKRWRLSDTVQF